MLVNGVVLVSKDLLKFIQHATIMSCSLDLHVHVKKVVQTDMMWSLYRADVGEFMNVKTSSPSDL